MYKFFTLVAFVFIFSVPVFAQDPMPTAGQDASYMATITKRSDKIVAGLGITDSPKYKRVLKVIADQYVALGKVHDTRNAQVKDLKAQPAEDKAAQAAKIKAVDDDVDAQLTKLHSAYLAKLGADLSADQIEKVKDAMTYNKVGVTYNGYTNEILTLTDAQKAQIKTWLIEAREIAMDAESAEKKTAVFTKYKGRINNYLSAQGYDLKKEGADWEARRKAGSN